MFLNILETFPLEILSVSFTLYSLFCTLITKWLYRQQTLKLGAPTLRSSHFKRLALQVMHPVLLFLCLGLVLGGFRIAPGVG